MSKWLVSIECQACYFYPDGSIRRNAPFNTVWIIDKHPALYLAETRQQFAELSRNPTPKGHEGPPPRVDDILAIYSAIEVPDGLLTEDQEDMLS